MNQKVKIVHILADGTRLDDITGYKVTKENCPGFYEALNRYLKGRDANDKAKDRTAC